MEEVDKEVLKEAVAQARAIINKSMPCHFYDAGTIVQPYFILLDAKYGPPKKRTGVNVNVIHRELELMIKSGDIANEGSWLDPRAIAEKEARIAALEGRHTDRPE